MKQSNWIGSSLKEESIAIDEQLRKEITKAAVNWYSNACVHNTKKTLFLDKEGEEIVKVLGFTVNMVYEVK